MTIIDHAETYGSEIPALAKTGEFQELKDERIRCTCRMEGEKPRGPFLAKFFKGPETSSKEIVPWVWVPPIEVAGEKTSAMATVIPLRVGERGRPLVTQCGKCRNTWAVFPTGPQPGITGTWLHMSYRPDTPASEPSQVGDRSVTGEFTAERIDGPGPLVMVRIDRPTWGTVAP